MAERQIETNTQRKKQTKEENYNDRNKERKKEINK